MRAVPGSGSNAFPQLPTGGGMAAARSFRTEQIRNVVVLGHGGSGKTTLIDAVCFASGTSRRKGSVGDGSALTMTTPEETGHGMSLQLTVAHAIWEETKVNLLDTPGYMDFVGEAAAAVRVADAAVVTVTAPSGSRWARRWCGSCARSAGFPA